MRTKFIIATCLFIITAAVQAKDRVYKSVAGDPMAARIYTLDNGLTVYLSANNEKPRIHTFIAVRTGSRNDPAETTGLAHYLEHLMFKGTKRFGTSDAVKEEPLLNKIEAMYEVYRITKDPAKRKAQYQKIDSVSQLAAQYNIPNEYDKLMSSIGGIGTNAYTSNDVTCYVENIPSNEVENWAKIQSDRFQNMVIRGFHTELESVYEEFNIGLGSDNRKVWTAMNKILFPTHPYGTQTTIGTQEHLQNPSITNIKNYFNRYYVPNNVAICMAGDFDYDKIMDIIEEYFGGWKANPSLSFTTYEPVKNLTAPKDTTVVGQEAEMIMMGWKFDGAASRQCDTLNIVSEMLTNGKAGLFDLNLNQQMKCQYAVAANSSMNEYSQMLLIGMPKEGQSLDEVKVLMIDEINKLKTGNFDDDLLPSVINNMKLNYYSSIESNEERADMFVDAFINGKKWEDVVKRIDRLSGITKKQIAEFTTRHFNDNYAIVYKRQGTDNSIKKIDKPQITAIPANRDKQSAFVKEIASSETEPIQPRFLDFNKDLTKGKTKQNLPLLYIKNVDNGLFTLTFKYDFGEESNKWLGTAAEYMDYLGTSKMSAEQLKRKFYKLACEYSISVGNDGMAVQLQGLNDNMAEALNLLETFLSDAKVNVEAYNNFTDALIKDMKDSKLVQKANFNALTMYGIYGEYNPVRNSPKEEELKNLNPVKLVDIIKSLNNYEHKVLYYGPYSMEQVVKIIDKHHKSAKKLLPVPKGKEYTEQPTPKNEIIIAPYDAKNIYMTQYNNSLKEWNPEQQPVIELFNEYFGGGMNTVVFQELRESRGLAYSAWAMYYTPKRKGHYENARTNIISQNDKMMDCIRTFNQIIDTIPQSQKAFDLAKQALTKRIAATRKTKTSVFNSYLAAQRLGINYDINKKIYEALPTITLNDMVNFEKQTMAKKTYRYMILGDEKNLDMESLEKIGTVKRVTTEDIFGH